MTLTESLRYLFLRVVPLPAELDMHRAVGAAVETIVRVREVVIVKATLVIVAAHDALQVLWNDNYIIKYSPYDNNRRTIVVASHRGQGGRELARWL